MRTPPVVAFALLGACAGLPQTPHVVSLRPGLDLRSEAPLPSAEAILRGLEAAIGFLGECLPEGKGSPLAIRVLSDAGFVRAKEYYGYRASHSEPFSLRGFVVASQGNRIYIADSPPPPGEPFQRVRECTLASAVGHEVAHVWLAQAAVELGPFEEGFCNWVGWLAARAGAGEGCVPLEREKLLMQAAERVDAVDLSRLAANRADPLAAYTIGFAFFDWLAEARSEEMPKLAGRFLQSLSGKPAGEAWQVSSRRVLGIPVDELDRTIRKHVTAARYAYREGDWIRLLDGSEAAYRIALRNTTIARSARPESPGGIRARMRLTGRVNRAEVSLQEEDGRVSVVVFFLGEGKEQIVAVIEGDTKSNARTLARYEVRGSLMAPEVRFEARLEAGRLVVSWNGEGVISQELPSGWTVLEANVLLVGRQLGVVYTPE